MSDAKRCDRCREFYTDRLEPEMHFSVKIPSDAEGRDDMRVAVTMTAHAVGPSAKTLDLCSECRQFATHQTLDLAAQRFFECALAPMGFPPPDAEPEKVKEKPEPEKFEEAPEDEPTAEE